MLSISEQKRREVFLIGDRTVGNKKFWSEVKKLAAEAKEYLKSYQFCKSVNECYFGAGFEYMSMFFMVISTDFEEVPKETWVMIGDGPPAILDAESCVTSTDALEAYIELCREWVEAVKKGKSTEGLMPITYRDSMRKVEESLEFANMLTKRLEFLNKNFGRLTDE